MEGSHDVFVSVNEVLLLVSQHDLATTVLGKQDGVSLFHEAWSHGSIIEVSAGAHCDHFTEIQLLFIVLWQQDASFGLGDGGGFFDDDSVHEGSEFLECEHFDLSN